MTKYRVGIIGTGFGTKVQAPAFTQHPRFEVVAIAGSDESKTKKQAEALGVEYWTNNWKKLLQEDLDLISVATPPYQHYEMGKSVLEKGTPLLLEKPTTSNASEAKELYLESKKKGIVAMLSHEFRNVPVRAYLQELIQSGKIGNPREVHLQQYYGFAASPRVGKFGWFWESKYDGGLLGALGSHLIDWLRYTLKDEFTQVQGSIHTRVKNRVDSEGITHKVTADDGFSFNFSTQSGVNGDIIFSSTAHHNAQHLIIGGDKGTLILENNSLKLSNADGVKELTVPDAYALDLSLQEVDGRIPPYLKLLDSLALSLDEGKSYSPSLYDGWKNQQVLDAVKFSSATGSKISITD